MATSKIVQLPVAIAIDGREYIEIAKPTTPDPVSAYASARVALGSLIQGGIGKLNQNANTVFAGPPSGPPAPPAFRPLVAADFGGDTSGLLDNISAIRGSLLARGASSWQGLNIGAANTFLKSDGTDPSWQSGAALTKTDDTNVTLTLGGTAANALVNPAALALGWTGQLSVPRGGTGAATLTDHGVLLGHGTGAVTASSAMSNGQLLVGQTGADPLPQTVSGDASLAASGSLTLATVNSNVGTFGTASQVGNFTVNGKGLITAASNTPISIPASQVTSGQGLTKADDTNVTLTFGGSPSTALLAATSLTLGWAGQLAVSRGGTGQSTASAAFTSLADGIGSTQGQVLFRGASGWQALNPGTPGQVLITSGPGANPSWTTVAATGDVVGPASATDNAIARFDSTSGKVIQNSQVIVDDLGNVTGVASVNTGPLAGFRNRLVNGGMLVNQRNVASVNDDIYCFDRWYALTQTGAVGVSTQFSIENGWTQAIRLSQSQASAQRFGLAQIVEGHSSQDLRVKAVTLSIRARISASTNLRIAILQWTGTADSVTSDVVNDWTSTTFTPGNFFIATNLTVVGVAVQAFTANTPAAIQVTGTVGGTTNNLHAFVWTDAAQAQNVTLDLGNAQLEVGSVATEFERRPFAIEEMLCHRYFVDTQSAGALTLRFYNMSGSVFPVPVFYFFPKPMRTTPTLTATGDINDGPDFTVWEGGTTSRYATSQIKNAVPGGGFVDLNRIQADAEL